MIDLYYASTPNGWKIAIMCEECELPYNLISVNLGKGDQFKPGFLKISPNNRMPAIVDSDTNISLFESGAILLYLAEKTGKFIPTDQAGRLNVMQWLFWQVGGLGPMAGQLSHFVNYAPGGIENHEYSHTRYANEYDRLFAVMERSLVDNEYLAGDYSIADIASWPWVVPYKRFGQAMDNYPGVRRWFDAIKQRPAVRKAMDQAKSLQQPRGEMTEEQRKMMFSQNGQSITQAAEDAER